MTKEIMNFSMTLFGVKSPNPMVDSVVIPKYQTLIRELMLDGGFYCVSSSYCK